MNEFSIAMAIVDYIPVVLFTMAAIILMRDLYNKMSKGAFAIFASGLLNIAFAGMLKATWKLLYAAGVCDFAALNTLFLPLQSIGFLLAGIGMLAMLTHKQTGSSLKAAVPPVFAGTFLFIGLMVLGLGVMDGGLCVLAAKLKKKSAILVFALSFVCSLAMGYLSSRDFALASMNWIAEGVNTVGQGLFLLGAILLHENGLAELKLHNGENV